MILSGFPWSGWYSGVSRELKTDHSAPWSSLCIHCLWFCCKREKCYGIEMRQTHQLGMRAHFQVGMHRRTASVRNRRPGSTFRSPPLQPRLPHYTRSLDVTIQFLCFWAFTLVFGEHSEGEIKCGQWFPFITYSERAMEPMMHYHRLCELAQSPHLISRLLSVPQKKLGEVVRSSQACVVIYSCN